MKLLYNGRIIENKLVVAIDFTCLKDYAKNNK
jgi:hypothetical protein